MAKSWPRNFIKSPGVYIDDLVHLTAKRHYTEQIWGVAGESLACYHRQDITAKFFIFECERRLVFEIKNCSFGLIADLLSLMIHE